MILGNVDTFKSCRLISERLMKYVELLKDIPQDAPDGRTELTDGVFYFIRTAALKDGREKNFECHRRYVDVQYILDGEEIMLYADRDTLTPAVPYNAEKDIEFFAGKGSSLVLKKGDFAIFCPNDAHAPDIATEFGASKKVVLKLPV